MKKVFLLVAGLAGLLAQGDIRLAGILQEDVSGKEPVAAPAPADPQALLERIRPLAQPVAGALMQSLEGRLKEAMAAGGPEAAVTVCQEQALALTQAVREEKEIAYLKRVGLRIRNPENAPDPAEQRALAHFRENGTGPGEFPADWAESVALADGSTQLRYYKAIPMQPQCLMCHGSEAQIPPNLRQVLDRLYPDDAARDFRPGELRGLLVVGLHDAPPEPDSQK